MRKKSLRVASTSFMNWRIIKTDPIHEYFLKTQTLRSICGQAFQKIKNTPLKKDELEVSKFELGTSTSLSVTRIDGFLRSFLIVAMKLELWIGRQFLHPRFREIGFCFGL